MTALQTTHVSHTEYADDIALSANTATHLQLQLDRFHTYTIAKGLTLNTQKTKVMAFFCSNPPIFQYNGTPLENVQEFKYLGTSLSHNGRMTNASNQMARNFAGAIARVWKICTELGIKHRKHAMLGYSKSLHFLQAFLGVRFGLQILCRSHHLPKLKPTSITYVS